jgi:predicted acetyltransferase
VQDATLERTQTFQLTGDESGAECVTAPDAAADFELPIASLSAAYLGGTSIASLARAGRLRQVNPGASLPRPSAAFTATDSPCCIEHF